MKNLLLLLSIATTFSAQAAIWQNTAQWDQETEKKFSEWVEFSYNTTIFTEGRYKGVPTDCADSVYASRAIFSYENGLPFSIKDYSGGNKLITNSMRRYDKIKNTGSSKDKRFKRFLRYIFDMTSTKTLPGDTYPVEINRDWVKAGGVFVRPRITAGTFFGGTDNSTQPGHAELIKKVDEKGILHFIGSTVPQAVRKLHTTTDLTFMPKNEKSGIRYWKTQEVQQLAKTQIPGYSHEQYEMGTNPKKTWGTKKRKKTLWKIQVKDRLKLRDESKEEMKYRYAQDFCTTMEGRVEVIIKADKKRIKLNRCMNFQEFDNYSTPSRDKKLRERLNALINLRFKYGKASKYRINKMAKYFENCNDINIDGVHKITMAEAAILLAKKKLLSDPNQTLAARWGQERKSRNKCEKFY